MKLENSFNENIVEFDIEKAVEYISIKIRSLLKGPLKRRGIVLGLSGGIDSSTTAALCVNAVGQNKTIGLLMPEEHSSDESYVLGQKVAETLGIKSFDEYITPVLKAVGFYSKYVDAVRTIFPEYSDEWKSKIVLPDIVNTDEYSIYSIVVQNPDGETFKKRLSLKGYLGIVAATNFKQRIRKMMEYYYADLNNYAVAGTPNRLEYDQGFFVKLGDGAADLKPIAHLYKTQVFKVAEYFGIPSEIISRIPTTDTYSMKQGQDEFYFSLAYEKMDICLYARNNNFSVEETAEFVGLTAKQVKKVFTDIEIKRNTTKYLHLHPLLMEKIKEVELTI